MAEESTQFCCHI